jgi:hypothetical protein
VGALGVPFGNVPLISRSNYGFLETDLRINNDRAYHALAVDEHREAFAPTLWTRTIEKGTDTCVPRPLDQVEQRWFVGAHADVGGGYENGLLAQIPLKWLMQKAESPGLTFKYSVNIDGDENQALVHDSFAEWLVASTERASCRDPSTEPLALPHRSGGDSGSIRSAPRPWQRGAWNEPPWRRLAG